MFSGARLEPGVHRAGHLQGWQGAWDPGEIFWVPEATGVQGHWDTWGSRSPLALAELDAVDGWGWNLRTRPAPSSQQVLTPAPPAQSHLARDEGSHRTVKHVPFYLLQTGNLKCSALHTHHIREKEHAGTQTRRLSAWPCVGSGAHSGKASMTWNPAPGLRVPSLREPHRERGIRKEE